MNLTLTDTGTGQPAVAVVGVDAFGNASANIVPRTNTLSSLKTLVGSVDGELASATDTARIVQIHTNGRNSVYAPDGEDFLVTGSGSVAVTIPTAAKNVYLSKASGVTAIAATLQNGVVEGQEFNLFTQSVSVLTLLGFDAGPSYQNESHAFIWSVSATAWRRVRCYNVGAYPSNFSAPFDSNILLSGWAWARSAVAIAGGSVGGYQGLVIGRGQANGIGALVVQPRSSNSCEALGSASVVLASPGSADSPFNGGNDSVVIGNGMNAIDAPSGGRLSANITAISLVSGSNYSVTVNLPDRFQIGCRVLLRALSGPSAAGSVSSLAGSVLTVVISPSVGTAANSVITATEMLAMSTIYNTSEGANSIVIGNAVARNSGILAEASNLPNSGLIQSETCWLVCNTDSATQVPATKDGEGAFTGTGVGLQNSFVIEASCAYQIEFVIVGFNPANGDIVKWRREMVVSNVAGTSAIKQTAVVIGTDVATGGLATLTYAGSVTVALDATTDSLRFSVGGVAGTNLDWGVRLHALRVI